MPSSMQHESNSTWLDDLVSDIIDASSRGPSRAYSKTSEDDFDAADSETERWSQSRRSSQSRRDSGPSAQNSRASPSSRRRVRSPSFNKYSHYSYRSTTPMASRNSQRESSIRSTPIQDMAFETISEDGNPVSPFPFYQPRSRLSMNSRPDSPKTARTDTTSRQRPVIAGSPSLDPHAGQSTSPLPHLPERMSPLPATITPVSSTSSSQRPLKDPSIWSGDTRTSTPDPDTRRSATKFSARSKTSLGRTYSQQRLSELQTPPLARIISDVADDFTGFAPHPAVRPFTYRDGLGGTGLDEEEDDHEYPKPFALALIVTGICLSVFIISVDRNIVTTAIPEITETFRSYNDIGWYGSAYFLTASAFQPLYGRVYMSFDTRWTFILALVIFELGSVLGGVSPNSDVLILGRAVQGFGSAGILTGSFVVGTHSVPLRGRPVLFAFVGILYGVGALAGPLLGGVFTDLLNWRWVFWINLPVGAVTFIAVLFFFKPRKQKNAESQLPFVRRILQLDLIGNAILLGACVMLFLALQLSESRGNWNNAPVIGLLTGFGVSVVIFVGWLLYRGDKALIPPRIIRQRTVAASCGAAFFIYGGLLIHAYYLPIWFQAIQGDSAIHSGVNMIPYMLANALFSLMAGIFVSKNGLFAPPAIIGNAIGTVGCGLLATIGPNTSTGTWIGYEILVSAGLGMAIQQGFSAVQTALPLEEVPIGTAAVVASQSLGGAIFVSIGNTILQDHLLNHNAENTIPGVDVRAVFRMGATMFRSVVPEESLPALINLYNDSLQGVFIAAVPLIGCAFLCSLCMEWRSVKAKQELARKKVETEKP